MNTIFSNKLQSKSVIKLLDYLNQQFKENGFRNFSITDVANDLRISKKTIYKSYRTKEEIIRIILIRQLSSIYSNVHRIIKSQSDIINKLSELSLIVEEYFTVFNEHSLKRLGHNFPDLADYIEKFKINRIIPIIEKLLNIGKKNGLIRSIPNDIIIKVFTTSLSEISELKNKYQSPEIFHNSFREVFDLLMKGIVTNKGKKYLNNKSEVKNENN